MRTPLLMTTFLLLVGFCASASGQKCLEYGPDISLTGTLRSQVYPGPPNYESIKRGDRKEKAIILMLDARACTMGNDPPGFDVPETDIRQIQLVITNDEHWRIVRRLMGKPTHLTGSRFNAQTGHHRTRVLIHVANIRAAA